MMKRFLIGLGFGLLGAVVWFISSVLAGMGQATNKPAPVIVEVFVGIGFFVMLGAPLYFWVIQPIFHLVTRRKQHVTK